MDELKNMRNFTEFKDESLNEKAFIKEFGHLNEEALWATIKNLFSKIFGSINKALADAVANFTQKLDKSKSWEESVKYFNEALTLEAQDMQKSLEGQDITGAWGLRKVVGDNASIIFIQWLEMKNKYGIDTCAPKNVFQGNAMFQFDKSDDFNKNILNASNAVLFEVNKGIQPNPFDEAALKAYLDKSPEDINKVQTGGTSAKPSYMTGAKDKVVPSPTGEGYNFNGDKLFEIAASQPNPSGNAANITPTDTSQKPTTEQPPQKSPIDILKEATAKYINDKFYQYSAQKIKEIKPPAKIGNEDAMLALAKGSKATTLHQNLAKMLRYIINVQDKPTLLKVRDAIASDPNLKKSANDLKNEIPL